MYTHKGFNVIFYLMKNKIKSESTDTQATITHEGNVLSFQKEKGRWQMSNLTIAFKEGQNLPAAAASILEDMSEAIDRIPKAKQHVDLQVCVERLNTALMLNS